MDKNPIVGGSGSWSKRCIEQFNNATCVSCGPSLPARETLSDYPKRISPVLFIAVDRRRARESVAVDAGAGPAARLERH